MWKARISGPSGSMGWGEGCLCNSCLSSQPSNTVLPEAEIPPSTNEIQQLATPNISLDVCEHSRHGHALFVACVCAPVSTDQRTQSPLAGAAHPPTVYLIFRLMHRQYAALFHETPIVTYRGLHSDNRAYFRQAFYPGSRRSRSGYWRYSVVPDC